MASQVLSGTSNPSYTNNTGQNVRVIINYMNSFGIRENFQTRYTMTINWAGVSVTGSAPTSQERSVPFAIGRNLASITYAYTFSALETAGSGQGFPTPITSSLSTNNAGGAVFAANPPAGFTDGSESPDVNLTFPTELMLAPGQTFSAVCGVYNIVVIPEAG